MRSCFLTVRERVAIVGVILGGSLLGAVIGWFAYEGIDVDV